jgi:hypothetical protein
MTKIVFEEGTGILSGTVWDDEEMALRREEERKLQQAVAERLAAQEALKGQLETAMVDYLKDEIAEELRNQEKPNTGSDKRSREDFKRFRAYCARLDLPALPADPRTVAGFLASEINKGRPHLRRLIKAISVTHLRCDLHDPTSDLLVRALLRLAIEHPPQTDKPSN